MPTQECNVHVLATVCPDTNLLANPTCLKVAGTTEIVCIDRHYTEKPSVLPRDFDYEVPMDYCTFHYCPVDEYGNFITVNYDDYNNDENQEGNSNIDESGDKKIDEESSNNNSSGEREKFWWEE